MRKSEAFFLECQAAPYGWKAGCVPGTIGTAVNTGQGQVIKAFDVRNFGLYPTAVGNFKPPNRKAIAPTLHFSGSSQSRQCDDGLEGKSTLVLVSSGTFPGGFNTTRTKTKGYF